MENTEHMFNFVNEKPEPKLNYRNIINEAKKSLNNKEGFVVEGQNYTATYGTTDDFIYIKKRGKGETDEIEGLKFHISVDPLKMSEAWKIVMDVMARHGVREAKFSNPLNEKGQEPGKEITLYAFKEPSRPILRSQKNSQTSWEEIISEITIRLHQAGIQPGAAAKSNSEGGGFENIIEGTNYVTGRDDFEMMAYVKPKVPLQSIPLEIDDTDLDNYFETVNMLLNHEDDADVRYKETLFKYFHNHVNDFNQLGHDLKLELNLKLSEQLERLLPDEHLQRREHHYKKVREAPIFQASDNQTFGTDLRVLKQLTQASKSPHMIQSISQNSEDKVTLKGKEKEEATSSKSEEKHKKFTSRLNLFKPRKKERENTQPKVSTTQTVQDNDFTKRLEKIVSSQGKAILKQSTPGNVLSANTTKDSAQKNTFTRKN